MIVISILYREYFLILDFNYYLIEEKDLKINNLRELVCKKKIYKQNKNIFDIRLYNLIFLNG